MPGGVQHEANGDAAADRALPQARRVDRHRVGDPLGRLLHLAEAQWHIGGVDVRDQTELHRQAHQCAHRPAMNHSRQEPHPERSVSRRSVEAGVGGGSRSDRSRLHLTARVDNDVEQHAAFNALGTQRIGVAEWREIYNHGRRLDLIARIQPSRDGRRAGGGSRVGTGNKQDAPPPPPPPPPPRPPQRDETAHRILPRRQTGIRFRVGHRMRRHLSMVALTALAACEGPFIPPPVPPPPPPAVASVQVAPASVRVVAGDTVSLTATLRDSSGALITERPVAWQSADLLVAVVSPNGVVHGINPGTTAIRATAGGHTDSATVVVTPVVFTAISTGAAHGCATADNQHLYCWGDNTYGQTGTGSGNLVEPTPRLLADPAPYTSVAAGGDHTCGLTTGGAAVCWGRNDQGQLGRGGTPGNPALPAPVATTLRFALLVSGSGHSCGLATGGLTYCWGLDFAGQLGDGGTTSSDTPRPALTDTAFATLSAGSNHTCALTTGGRAFCWGANPLGQLGDSTRANRGTPVAVAGALVFTRLSAGGVHTCGLTTDSLAYCWGNNADGELGAGATSSQPTTMPVPVSGALHFADLHAGSAHTCGITGAQIVYCWGLGLRGQLGQVTLHTSAVPLRVAGQP